MTRLTIAIPTFRRPQDLKRAVIGVLEQAGNWLAARAPRLGNPRAMLRGRRTWTGEPGGA